MKLYAYLLVTVLMLSIFCEPLFEVFLVYKDRIMVGSAISNSCRAAKKMSVDYLSQRDLDAVINHDIFIENFAETFEKALDLTCTGRSGGELVFSSNDGNYNDFYVTILFNEEVGGFYSGSINTKVEVEAESVYEFKTKLLKEAEDLISSAEEFKLMSKRNYNIVIQN